MEQNESKGVVKEELTFQQFKERIFDECLCGQGANRKRWETPDSFWENAYNRGLTPKEALMEAMYRYI